MNNHNQPKGCIVEYYKYEEAIEFCIEYLNNIDAIGLPKNHFAKRKDENSKSG